MKFTKSECSLIYQGYRYVINRKCQHGKIFWRSDKSHDCSGGATPNINEIEATLPTFKAMKASLYQVITKATTQYPLCQVHKHIYTTRVNGQNQYKGSNLKWQKMEIKN